MKQVLMLALMGWMAFALTACLEGPNDHSGSAWDREVEANSPISAPNGGITPESAESSLLVERALPLVTPYTFMNAHDMIQRAVRLTPSNAEAQFYAKLLAIPMKTKGLMGRIDGKLLSRAPAKALNRYMSLQDALRSKPHELSEFLNFGEADIFSEAEVQDVILQLAGKIDEFRTFLKERANTEGALRVRLVTYDGLSRPSCIVTHPTPNSDPQLIGCGSMSVRVMNFSRADLEAMSLYAAAWELQTIALSSYDMTGLLDILRFAEREHWSQTELYNAILKAPTFGRLRSNHMISKILEIGSQGVSVIRYALRMQNEFCPRGRGSSTTGELFPEGICIGEQLSDGQYLNSLLDAASLALEGQTVTANFMRNGQWESTHVRLRASLETPADNVRAYLPVEFNPCNEPIEFGDVTLGGLFPGRDASEILLNRARNCQECPCFH